MFAQDTLTRILKLMQQCDPQNSRGTIARLRPVLEEIAQATGHRKTDEDKFLRYISTILLMSRPGSELLALFMDVVTRVHNGALTIRQARRELVLAGFSVWPRATPECVVEMILTEGPRAAQTYGVTWVAPIQSTDSDGDIVLEWLNADGTKRVTVFVESSGNVTYLVATGSNIHDYMRDGDLRSIEHLVELLGQLTAS